LPLRAGDPPRTPLVIRLAHRVDHRTRRAHGRERPLTSGEAPPPLYPTSDGRRRTNASAPSPGPRRQSERSSGCPSRFYCAFRQRPRRATARSHWSPYAHRDCAATGSRAVGHLPADKDRAARSLRGQEDLAASGKTRPARAAALDPRRRTRHHTTPARAGR
jgi:hypothetical protein